MSKDCHFERVFHRVEGWNGTIHPVNDKLNSELYAKYKELADKEENVIFGGRLAEYKYYDMAPIIEKVLNIYGYNHEKNI